MAKLHLSYHALDNGSNLCLVNVYLARATVVYTLSGANIVMMSEERVTTYSLPRWKDSQSREKSCPEVIAESNSLAFFSRHSQGTGIGLGPRLFIIDNLDKLSTNTLFIILLQRCLFMKIIPNVFMYRNICI